MSARGIAVERMFYAAAPDETTRDKIAAAATALPLDAAVLRVPPRNFHVTLAFVGEIPAASVSLLVGIGGAQSHAAFTLRFDACEYWAKPKVLVMAARKIPPAMGGLWRRLHADLAVHRWSWRATELRPHITLARKLSQAPVLPSMSAFDCTFREFSLMRSYTSGAGSVYTVVDTWPLLDDPLNLRKNSVN